MSTAPPPLSEGSDDRPEATRTQHAIRLLTILAVCGEDLPELGVPGHVKVMRSELRLQALDFWLRNPDYLADELVTKVRDEELDDSYLAVAAGLLNDPEPDLRWYPMPKWHYGAYEAIDDSFSILDAYGLAMVDRVGDVKNLQRSQFILTQKGLTAFEELADEPRLSWYAKQMRLVALVAGDDPGTRLKERQYKQAQYAQTRMGLRIAPIAPVVRERLQELLDSREPEATDREGQP